LWGYSVLGHVVDFRIVRGPMAVADVIFSGRR
jgi:hypothetical protein